MTDLPISRRRAETRQRLMEAAISVFAERGVLAASVEEICDRAGFTRGAFYSNFESKNDLVLALLHQEAAEAHEVVDRMAQSDLVGKALAEPHKLEAYAEQAVRLLLPTRRQDRVWVVAVAEIRLYATREPGIREAYLAFRRQTKTDMQDKLIALGQAAGWRFTIPAESAVEVLDAMYERVTLKMIMLDPDGSHPDRVQEMIAAYVDMMKALIRPAETGAEAPTEPETGTDASP